MAKVLEFKKKVSETTKPKIFSPHLRLPQDDEEFINRIDSIRQSLEKINALMNDLKGKKDVDN